ncbi:hypothetical protein L596_020346 [Steinernema carpocapsae]|uniref:Uncharacterized protein n=1 Tax=Steinernema carpocapsae TaxID=34508 RepID=A0A4U5MTF9_STECR|nr:hypothetical protein L596_020346 [Steinernema carpocapsae]
MFLNKGKKAIFDLVRRAFANEMVGYKVTPQRHSPKSQCCLASLNCGFPQPTEGSQHGVALLCAILPPRPVAAGFPHPRTARVVAPTSH